MRFYRWAYYAFMVLAGLIAGLSLAARRPSIGWVLVVLCLVLAFLFAERGRT